LIIVQLESVSAMASPRKIPEKFLKDIKQWKAEVLSQHFFAGDGDFVVLVECRFVQTLLAHRFLSTTDRCRISLVNSLWQCSSCIWYFDVMCDWNVFVQEIEHLVWYAARTSLYSRWKMVS
jgi:hypothetical protein